jgi:hypothetical protein
MEKKKEREKLNWLLIKLHQSFFTYKNKKLIVEYYILQ